ncbi:MAG: phosphatidate cytidylyltransferase [Pseudomonadota bacterium]
MSLAPGRWGDLRPRVLSAIVMIAVGALEIWLGGASFSALVIALTAVMIWELATITGGVLNPALPPRRRGTPLVIAAVAGLVLTATFVLVAPFAPVLLLVPSLLLALTPRRDRRIASAYGAAVMLAGYGLIWLRDGVGTPAILWIVAVVIVSDISGYFAGRLLGGPKFWPAISPKKTWSGTVAGWIGAMLVGVGFVLAGRADWWLVVVSPLVALAGQLGDIAESWIKRRTGVKDSSALIPGHGGVMDRFDAMIGAVCLVLVLGLILPFPLPEAH